MDERYPFKVKWPDAPTDYNPVGTYRKEITLSNEFLSEDVILKFAAAKFAMYVYVNAKYVGYSQGSKTPAEFNISEYLKKGKILIALQLFRWSDASYLESQDMFRMSGIERDVFYIPGQKFLFQIIMQKQILIKPIKTVFSKVIFPLLTTLHKML